MLWLLTKILCVRAGKTLISTKASKTFFSAAEPRESAGTAESTGAAGAAKSPPQDLSPMKTGTGTGTRVMARRRLRPLNPGVSKSEESKEAVAELVKSMGADEVPQARAEAEHADGDATSAHVLSSPSPSPSPPPPPPPSPPPPMTMESGTLPAEASVQNGTRVLSHVHVVEDSEPDWVHEAVSELVQQQRQQ